MNQSPSPQSVNAGVPTAGTAYPKTLALSLSLTLSVEDAEQESYLVDSTGSLQLGFLADLFDLLNFEQELGVLSINGITPEDCRKQFQKFIP